MDDGCESSAGGVRSRMNEMKNALAGVELISLSSSLRGKRKKKRNGPTISRSR